MGTGPPAPLRGFPRPASADLRAGLVHGLVSVPDGLAAGLLAGLSPMAGLYGYLFGTLTGALATSSVLMSVQGTGAMAVIIADTPDLRGADAPQALATLTVLTGVIMLAHQSNRVTLKRWTFAPGTPLPTESEPPAVLPADEVVVLTPYGSLFFASATVFESQLPDVTSASTGSVVVLRLRGKEELGSTFINTLVRYHDRLAAVGSHLILTGLGDRVLAQLGNTGAIDRFGAENIFAAGTNVGESLQAGLRRARHLQQLG